MADLQSIANLVNKEVKQEILHVGTDAILPEVRRISTGSMYLDWALNGGIPTGKITEIFGPESSGKSALAAKIVSNAQKAGLTCIWIDAENSFDVGWMHLLGVDTDKLLVASSAEGEDMLELMFKLVSFGNPLGEYKNYPKIDLIVCDSLAALTPMAVIEKEMDENHMAVEARLNNRGIKRLNARNKTAAIVFINQVRSGIGRMAADFTPGGRALKFYSAARIEVRGGEWIKANQCPPYMKMQLPKDKDEQIGHNIRFRLRKLKVGPPFREANFDFYYNGKIDTVKDIVTTARLLGIIEASGAWIKYNGNNYQGIKGFAEYLKSDREGLKLIRSQIKEKFL